MVVPRFDRICMCALQCMTNCTSEIKTKVVVLCIECFQIVGGIWFFGRFPGFFRLSLWQEQHADEEENGAMVE